jgi:serine/threonine protein kinase
VNDIEGTFACLAPEQTGHTGWAVDQRVDLYSLGASLYEMATGEPPFGNGDILRLVHDHLTRVPTPARKRNPEVPDFEAVAAEQYLAVPQLLTNPAERMQAAQLLRQAADHTRLLANHALTEHFLRAAIDLREAVEGSRSDSNRLRGELQVERHAALLGLGRCPDDESDEPGTAGGGCCDRFGHFGGTRIPDPGG